MKKLYKVAIFYLAFAACSCGFAHSQTTETTKSFKQVQAGSRYKRSSFYQWLMGTNYRKEWTTPVSVPVMMLDTARGGLIAYKAGGGHQTKSLHVKTAAGKEYALRSVDKTLGKVLPEVLHNTFLEAIVNDEVSMSHPYGAVSVVLMAQKAGIYHTLPQFVYLPKQPLLDTFNKKFGNTLYLFEQRLAGNWQEANNLGNFKEFFDTYTVIDQLKNDNHYKVNQQLFVTSRLFDMFIGDWDRHEDQWQWGIVDSNNEKIYQPLPQDRDQAYFKYNGQLLKLLISASGLKYFQAFDYKLPDVKTFNYEERNLDRFFLNELTAADWQRAARNLQAALTDEVITASVKQLPPEIFSISGQEIIAKLQSRRKHLVEYATTYYNFIAKQVDIVGSKCAEEFDISRVNNNETAINIYRITNDKKEQVPFYSRVFKTGETKEVRLYGLSGNDVFKTDGIVEKGIIVRVIGGDQKDSIIDRSRVTSAGGKNQVYDDTNNTFITSNKTNLHLSADTSIHSYTYFGYVYDKRGISPVVNYNYEDRLYVGINAHLTHHKWRRIPFAYSQSVAVNYSISQHAASVTYTGLYPNAIGRWDFLVKGNFDAIRWTKFFGLGNETPLLSTYNDFYRMQSREWLASVGVSKKIGNSKLEANVFFKSTKIISDAGRFVPKVFADYNAADVATNNFTGAKISYIYDKVNDLIVPTKGMSLGGNVTYSHNLSQASKDFTSYSGTLQLYVPIVSKISLAIQTAAATVAGSPLFYQYASIGGAETLRGYRLDRFWGKTAFYDANELRYITNVKSYIYNGKVGLLALFDNGRVWMPNEKSDKWHTAYGGGILLAPFNKIQILATYAGSNEMRLFQLKVGRSF